MIRVRALLFIVYFVTLTLVMGLGALPIRILRRRDAALRYAQRWSALTLWGLSAFCRIRIRVVGTDHLPDGPCLIAAQHQSYFDGFVWMNLVRNPAYVIKQELTRIPFVGPMLLLSGMIPVERSAGARALRSLMKASQDHFDRDRQIIIFPEGTRTAPGKRVALQPGIVALAKQASVPIIPVATNSGLHWPRRGWLMQPGEIVVAIGAPVPGSAGRASLIDSIYRSWNTLSERENIPHPVDNSVDPEY
ncbi:lysophospholipid acyltransferase family protein [Swaminathania salitolerans]|uniref:1-acyl-sn-glycerol-3-phosphate acyltransferase n=1 Tax=Swaminathania salitolerans TaxID=182838 RepID=A0A511BS21_9PROT|nr:lysophospholipid acyltransferase family protein [Swaminathania salitolerans]GBQ12689.1 1-acyl-sn-glycerol-3-phosphate acyltransferase [Swaminathania salitolerans LMG 21291]GEL03136.1 1-acyl-sn-glycerol-3-phosphate acyltransferase [Swaminathania salitolerans]